VQSGTGESVVLTQFGIPLVLAFSLLRDVQGDITLSLPISGDAKSADVGLTTLIRDAIVRALLNSLTSPLKVLSALVPSGSKAKELSLAPIGFVPGVSEIAMDAWWRIDQLVGLLASHPNLKVELRGGTGAEDVRGLQEQALLAELERENGFVVRLRRLPGWGKRQTILKYLKARAQGKTSELSSEHATRLDTWLAARPLPDAAALHALAEARASYLQTLLSQSYGVGATRIRVVPAPDAVGSDSPAVATDLAGGS